MKKHINIPIFIPHMGCPNNCVFCNQRSISGRQSFDARDVEGQIDAVLSTLSGDTEREIAFFGGSFTGIERELNRPEHISAGYTGGGAAYGLTWEEVGIDPELPFEEKVRLYYEEIE